MAKYKCIRLFAALGLAFAAIYINNVSGFSVPSKQSVFATPSMLLRRNNKNCSNKSFFMSINGKSTNYNSIYVDKEGGTGDEKASAPSETVDRVVNVLGGLRVVTLKNMLKEKGMSAHGTKIDLVTKLALRQLKAEELANGHFDLNKMTVPALRELKKSLGVKGTASKKSDMVQLLQNCLV